MSMTRLSARGQCEPETATILLGRLQHRDPAALGELYDLYARLAYSLALRIVRDAGIAEDLVQETFWCVWQRAALFDSRRGAVGAWLLTIARNRALDSLRSSQSRQNYGLLRENQTEIPKLFAYHPRDAAIVYRRNLRDAVQRLSKRQRTIIDLAYFEGYSQTEIAAKLGYPLGTVKTWFRSALKTLREHIEKPHAFTSGGAGLPLASNFNTVEEPIPINGRYHTRPAAVESPGR